MDGRKIKRLVLTGPTGAVGTAIIKKCIENKIQVTAITRKDSKRNNHIPLSPYVRVYYSDIDKYDDIDRDNILPGREENFDAFIHLAWKGTIGDGRNQVDLQMENIKYTVSAVRLAKRLGCQIFMGAGSQAEYGRVEGYLKANTPVFPENGYGIGKLCAGQMSRLLCSQLKMEHIWLRILSVYGPNDGEQTMVSTAIKKFLSGEHTAFTPGEQQWDYLYSEDAAEIILKLVQFGKSGKTYCVGSGQKRMLKEYIHDIYYAVRKEDLTDRKLGIGEVPYNKNQVMFLCADISELEEDVGKLQITPFKEGIGKTVEWYKKNIYNNIVNKNDKKC